MTSENGKDIAWPMVAQMGASTHHRYCDPRQKTKAIEIIEVETRLGGCIEIEMVLKGRT